MPSASISLLRGPPWGSESLRDRAVQWRCSSVVVAVDKLAAKVPTDWAMLVAAYSARVHESTSQHPMSCPPLKTVSWMSYCPLSWLCLLTLCVEGDGTRAVTAAEVYGASKTVQSTRLVNLDRGRTKEQRPSFLCAGCCVTLLRCSYNIPSSQLQQYVLYCRLDLYNIP